MRSDSDGYAEKTVRFQLRTRVVVHIRSKQVFSVNTVVWQTVENLIHTNTSKIFLILMNGF